MDRGRFDLENKADFGKLKHCASVVLIVCCIVLSGCFTTTGSQFVTSKRLLSSDGHEPIIAPFRPVNTELISLKVSDFDTQRSSYAESDLPNNCDFQLGIKIHKNSDISIKLDAFAKLTSNPSDASNWIRQCHCEGSRCTQNNRSQFKYRFSDYLDSAIQYCRNNPSRNEEKITGVKCTGKLSILESLPLDASLSASAKNIISKMIGNPVSYPSTNLITDRNIFSDGSFIGQQVFPGEYLCLIGGGHTNANINIVDETYLGYSTNEPVSQNCIPINLTMSNASDLGIVSDPLVVWLEDLEKVDEYSPPRHGADAILGATNLFGVSLRGHDKGYDLGEIGAFKHVMLISRYKRRSIANGKHVNEGKKDESYTQNLDDVDNHRPSYLLFFQNYSDLESIRDKFLEEGIGWKDASGNECFFKSLQNNLSHECFDTVVQGKFLDMIIPSNIETYVSTRITVNGIPENVRVGTTLASLLSREMPLLDDWKTKGYNGPASDYYNSKVKLERFIDNHLVRIDFSSAMSFADYSIPLQAGDNISWR